MTAVHTGPAIVARAHLWTERGRKYYIDTGIVHVSAPTLVVEPSFQRWCQGQWLRPLRPSRDGGLH